MVGGQGGPTEEEAEEAGMWACSSGPCGQSRPNDGRGWLKVSHTQQLGDDAVVFTYRNRRRIMNRRQALAANP